MITSICLAIVVGASIMLAYFLKTDNANALKKRTIVVDAGHGGIDKGVIGSNTNKPESELNLEISFKLKEVLEEGGFNVVLTRESNAGLYGTTAKGFKKRDMKRRAEIINKANPLLIISIHQNKFPASYRRGAQVFFDSDNKESKRLAISLQNAVNDLEESLRDFSVLKGDYFILNCTTYPCALIECGFLSNPEEEKLLLSDEYQYKLCGSIYKGIVGYLSI